MNLYTYAFNNPLSFTDPSGWWPQNDPAENYDEPTGYAPTGGGDVYYVLPNWYNGPADPFAGMGFDFEGKLHDAYINTVQAHNGADYIWYDDGYGNRGYIKEDDILMQSIGNEAYNWIASQGFDNVKVFHRVVIHGVSMSQDPIYFYLEFVPQSLQIEDFKDTYRSIMISISYLYSWEHGLLPDFEKAKWNGKLMTTKDLFDDSITKGWEKDTWGSLLKTIKGLTFKIDVSHQFVNHVHFNESAHTSTR